MTRWNRRGFLKAGAVWAGAAGMLIVKPQRVAGSLANSRIKLGLIGCGGRGRWIAGLFAEHEGYQLHAVADYFPDVAAACGDQFQIDPTRRFSGLSAYQKLIASGVDAVALETPPYCFPQHAHAAVAAGLHVYMAKPVAVDVPGALEMAQLGKTSSSNQRCFLVDFQIPTDPLNAEVVQRVRDGALGRIAMIQTYYLAGRFSDPPLTGTVASRLRQLVWVNDVALGGSYHVNACIHAVQGGLWLAGQLPIAAAGASSIGRPDPHGDSCDQYCLTFEFADGLLMSHVGSHLNTPFHVRCLAFGQQGTAEIGYTGQALVRGGQRPYEGGEIADLYAAGAKRNIARFHRCIADADFSNATVEPAVNSTLATILGREAAARDTRLTMDELIKENRRIQPDLSGL